MNKTNPAAKQATIDHLNLSVRNYQEAVEWYRRVFGFKEVEAGGDSHTIDRWGILKSGDTMLCIYERKDLASASAGKVDHHQISHFGMRVHEVEVWEKTLKECGLKTYFGSPVRYPHSQSWYVKDPSGHTIEVSNWMDGRIQF
ncbi:MAG: VOC family protein [Bdellovibrionota bacterium]